MFSGRDAIRAIGVSRGNVYLTVILKHSNERERFLPCEAVEESSKISATRELMLKSLGF